MNPFSIPPLISALLFLFLGIFVFLKSKKKPSIILPFFLNCFVTFWWQFFWFLLFNTENTLSAGYLVKIGYSGIIFIPVTFFHFYTNFLDLRKNKKWIRIYYGVSFVFLLLLWTTNLYINGFYVYFWGYYPRAGTIHPAYFLFLIATALHCFYSLKTAGNLVHWSGMRGNQIKYLIGALCIYCFASWDFITNYGIEVYPFGFIPLLLCLGILTYSIVKHHLMNIKTAITRASIFLFIYFLVLGIPFWFTTKLENEIFPLLLMFALASFGPFTYRLLQRKAEDLLMAQQRYYQKILLDASMGMVKEHDLNRLCKLIVFVVKKAVRINFAMIFVDDKTNRIYHLKAVRYSKNIKRDIDISYDHPFITYVKNQSDPFHYNDMPAFVKKSLHLPVSPQLIVPSFVDNNLLGFILLGKKMNKKAYTEDDLNIFRILARQTALAVENCLFSEEFQNFQAKIASTEKLASIGGMADGLAHQLKNRLNLFSVAAGAQHLAIEVFMNNHKDLVAGNPELKKSLIRISEVADSIMHNVDRTEDVINGILNFSRMDEKEIFFSHFPFKEIIDSSIAMLKIKHQTKIIPLSFTDETSGTLFGVKTQIMESLYNIMDDAYEAIEEKTKHHLKEDEREKFRPLISITLAQDNEDFLITISDNGIGIPDENKNRIFSPFFSTKSSSLSGSGIGMYIVKRIIEENHKGKIWFDSEYMKGTTFTIRLPVKQDFD